MKKEEYDSRWNRKGLGEIAEDRIIAYLSSDCTDDGFLFKGIDERFIGKEDLSFVRSVFSTSVSEESQDLIKQFGLSGYEMKLVQLMNNLREASEAMNTNLMKMLHKMRAENDYSGLGMLYDTCDTDQPYSIYQLLGDMIFCDRYSEADTKYRIEVSPLFASYNEKFDSYFGGLLADAEAAGASFTNQYGSDYEDNDENSVSMLDRFREYAAAHMDDDCDILSLTDVHKRTLQASAFLMAFSFAVEEVFVHYAGEFRHQSNQWAIRNLLQLLHSQEDVSSEDYYGCCALFLGVTNECRKDEKS